jgi:cellulose synthase/poly-beta-1,6-N-acetylglucosamine synthase-like glycosyltransferase
VSAFSCLFAAFLLAAFYPVAIYPFCVRVVAGLRARAWRSGTWTDRVAHVITVHNEEARIASKLENSLGLTGPPGGVETIVVDDGSTDGTESVVRTFASRGVVWVPHPRAGKEAAQIAALRATSCGVIVFSDASTRIDRGSLLEILAPFADGDVAAVSGTDRPDDAESGTGEDLYVRYEMALRRAESRAGSLVGLSGCFFAVRREIADALLPEVPSDLGSALLAIARGKRAVAQDRATCSYASTTEVEREFARKRRTALRGLRCLWAYRRAVSIRRPLVSWEILSHKVVRFLSPFLLCLSLACLCVGAARGERAALLALPPVLIGIAIAVASAASGPMRRASSLRAAAFFLVSNVAVLAAWLDLLSGKRLATWTPTSR